METNITTEIIINAPREKVWEILTDFDNYKNWNPFVIKSTGKAVVGTRLVNTIKNGGRYFVFKPIILKIEKYTYLD